MPTLDAPKSPAVVAGAALYRPPRSTLRSLLDGRILNQSAWLYFDLRQWRGASLVQSFAPSTYSLTTAQIQSAIAQLYDQGLCKNFSVGVQLSWRVKPAASTTTAEQLRSQYFGYNALKTAEYVRRALELDYGTATTWVDFQLETFATKWILTLKNAAYWLRELEEKEILVTQSPSNSATITWHDGTPGADLSLTELKEMKRLKSLNDNGYIFFALKAIAPTGGAIDFNRLLNDWGLDASPVFEELAKYQNRQWADLALDDVNIEWVEIPVYTPKEKLAKRKGMFREHGWFLHILRTRNPTGVQFQADKLSAIATEWGIDTTDAIRYLRRLTALEILRVDLSKASLKWAI